MAKFDVVDLDLKKVGEIELSDAVFGAEPNTNLFYEVAKMQQINRRRGTVGVKNSSLVSRRRQEALEAEGHRPRSSGLHPRLPLGRRRQGDGAPSAGTTPTGRPARSAGARSARRCRSAPRRSSSSSWTSFELSTAARPRPAIEVLTKRLKLDERAGGGREGQREAPPQRAQPRQVRRAPARRPQPGVRAPAQGAGAHLRGRQGAGGFALMNDHRRHQGPAHHREARPAREKFRQYRFIVDREGHQARRGPRGGAAVQGHGRGCSHQHHARQDQAGGQEHRQAPQLQEGDRHPEGRATRSSSSREVRPNRRFKHPWASRRYKPTSAARRLMTVSDFADITTDRPEKTPDRGA